MGAILVRRNGVEGRIGGGMAKGVEPERLNIPREERDRRVTTVLWRILFLNILVAVLKLVFGFFAGAVSMLADGLHSLLDGSSNVVGLVGMRVARKAPDSDHPYGHRKFEALAALGIAAFLFISSYQVFMEVLRRFRGEHHVHPGWETFVVMVLTVGINLFVTRYERRQGKLLRSAILSADASHTQSDVYVSLGVIISLVAASLEFPILDVITALLIVLVIAWSGYRIVITSFSALADAQVVDPEQVVGLALETAGVTHAHRVRSRGLPDDIHVDLHVHVAGDMTTAQAHHLAHDVTDRIKATIPGVTDVVIHVEPEGHHEEDGVVF